MLKKALTESRAAHSSSMPMPNMPNMPNKKSRRARPKKSPLTSHSIAHSFAPSLAPSPLLYTTPNDDTFVAQNQLRAEQIAAAAFAKHAEAAQAALALAAQEGSDDEDEGERCMIWGCKRELLQCYGAKREVGSAVGMADEAHVVCAPCLTRWWEAQNKLLAAKGKSISARKRCPCCRCEIRSTVETRAQPDCFHSTGLMKIPGTW